MSRPHIPEDVKRTLRKEALFGCAKCGCPIIEYHHIIPWAEQQHNDPDHMVILCPTHHREFGKLSKSKNYALKANPHNKQNPKIKGTLGSDSVVDIFIVGTNTFIKTPIILEINGYNILSYKQEDTEILFNAFIPKADLSPLLHIIDNEVIVNVSDSWDFIFKTNKLTFKSKENEKFEIQIQNNIMKIDLDVKIFGNHILTDASSLNIRGSKFSGNTMESCGVGIGIG